MSEQTTVSAGQVPEDNPGWNEIFRDGVWYNNVGFVQLLGLCPLLAVSNTMINALGLAIATLLTLVVTNLLVSLLRGILRPEIRIPLFVLIIASVVTVIELVMEAWFHDLFNILGIFIPLIVTNCAIIGRAEAFASRHSPLRAAWDGLATGLGFALALIVLGGLREIIGQGSLFANAELLFGQSARWLEIQLIPEYRGFLLAMLPPGAFLLLGFLVAGFRALTRRKPASRTVSHES